MITCKIIVDNILYNMVYNILLLVISYYIVFVDDYTRVSWTYIMKSRKEVIIRVQEFVMEVTTQYTTTLKILRTDNALEFTQNAIHEFYTGKGIHALTPPNKMG